MPSTKVFVFAIIIASILATTMGVGWRKMLPQPFIGGTFATMIYRVTQSANFFWFLYFNGDFAYTPKVGLDYTFMALPQTTPRVSAIAIAAGINDDVCVIDEWYRLWCKYGAAPHGGASWKMYPTPTEAEFFTEIKLVAFASEKMVISDYYGTSFMYNTSSPTNWTKISDANTGQNIPHVGLCGDGSIFGASFEGDFYEYDKPNNNWILRVSGSKLSSCTCGYNSQEVAAVSPQYPFRNYRMQGSGTGITLWRFADYMTTLHILGSRTFASDFTYLYVYDY